MAARLLFILIISILTLSARANQPVYREVVGVVTDSVTGERLSYVNVFSKAANKGVLTDENGVFRIRIPSGANLEVNSMGYAPQIKKIMYVKGDTVRFRMMQQAQTLAEVVVKKKRNKYSKKNNPAVDLMQRVRSDKKLHDPMNEPYFSYDKYEKTLFGLNDFKKDLNKNGKTSFLRDYVDTVETTGKRILALSLKEKHTTKISDKENKFNNEIVTGMRSLGVDEQLDQESVRAFLQDILREIDVYSNDITLMQNRFVSPLSVIGADYYMYHIADTVDVDGEKCVELTFAPHNPESFSFNGRLYIPVKDSVKYVKRLSMRIPKALNLNYVDNIFINQDFAKDSLGNTLKEQDDVSLELKLVPGTPSFYVSRTSRYDNFTYEPRREFEKYYNSSDDEIVIEEAAVQDSEFWDNARKVPLSSAESKIGNMMTRFRQVPIFYWAEKILTIAFKGYVKTGRNSKFDIGPLNTFISSNTAEGLRLRFGGMTTANLSKRWFARGFVAYGFKDKKWKYSGELEYSFIDKKYHSREFPMNSIRATYEYDKDQLGQHYLFTNADNVFIALKRMKSDLITYRRMAKLEYNLELLNRLSFAVELRHEKQEATKWVQFENQDGTFDRSFNQAVAKFMIRWAPGERFVQNADVRFRVNLDAPIFQLTHEYGPKGFLGADFTLNKTEFSVQKRFWFSSFGYTDIILKAGKIWSTVPFPALLWQNANISYTIQPESFTLLNPMEFAMDQYASLDFTYYLNGLIFNRIPLVNKLKLREVFTFKGFVGHLSDKNNPEYNHSLYKFPEYANTVPMGKKPYMEIGAGIDNILTCLRVDYVWRLTYRNLPNVSRGGVRISMHFSF